MEKHSLTNVKNCERDRQLKRFDAVVRDFFTTIKLNYSIWDWFSSFFEFEHEKLCCLLCENPPPTLRGYSPIYLTNMYQRLLNDFRQNNPTAIEYIPRKTKSFNSAQLATQDDFENNARNFFIPTFFLEYVRRCEAQKIVQLEQKRQQQQQKQQQLNKQSRRVGAKIVLNSNSKTQLSCIFCANKSLCLKKCLGCGIAIYCTKECQKRDWKKHQFCCIKFKATSQESQNLIQSLIQLISNMEVESKQLKQDLIHIENENRSFRQEILQKELEMKGLMEQVQTLKQKFPQKDSDIKEFFDQLQTNMDKEQKISKWQFCVIGGNCGHHICEWEFTGQGTNHQLNKLKKWITIPSLGAQYEIEYSQNNTRAIQKRTTTQYTRFLRLFSTNGNNIELKTVFQLFDLKYWEESLLSRIPSIDTFGCAASLLTRVFRIPYQIAAKIQFLPIWSRPSFEAFKSRFQFWNESDFPTRNKVLFLFHGLKDSTSLEQIVANGFQLHFSNQGVYSRGFYFSESFEVCFDHYAQMTENKNKNDKKETKTVLLCAVNVGDSFVDFQQRSWNTDEPCMLNGKLLQSVQFEHRGAKAYVVPLNQQIHTLAAFQYSNT